MATKNCNAVRTETEIVREWLEAIAPAVMLSLHRDTRQAISEAIAAELGNPQHSSLTAEVVGIWDKYESRLGDLEDFMWPSPSYATAFPRSPEPKSNPFSEIALRHPFTDSQRVAFEGISEFLKSGTGQRILTGYAGTGKTYCVAPSVMVALSSGAISMGDVLLAAPTHKAVQVLGDAFQRFGAQYEVSLDFDTATVASMLGLRPVVNEKTGEQDFVPDSNARACFGNYKIVIIDEASMIPASLKKYIDQAQDLFQRVLFVGDRAQLPPVERAESDCDAESHESPVFELEGWHLTEVVRYSGELARLAEDVRENLDRRAAPPIERFSDRTITTAMGDRWHQGVLSAFTCREYQNNPDAFRLVAYRNATVDGWNRAIHGHRYQHLGDDLPLFVPGEIIVGRSPCTRRTKGSSNSEMLLGNGEEAQVLEVERSTLEGIDVWLLRVMATSSGKTVTLTVLADEGQETYRKQLQRLRSVALKAPVNRGQCWAKFYDFKEQFHDVTWSYALTVHKSQGSTFGTVFVDMPDMRVAVGRSVVTANKLLYVALTRAADRVIVRV